MQKDTSVQGTISEDLTSEELTNNSLNHTPILSDDFELFSFSHEHLSAKEKKRKKKAILALSGGFFSLFAIGIIGFMSLDESIHTNLSASVVDIPFSLNKVDSLDLCTHEVIKKSSTEIERIEGEKWCKEKFTISTSE